MEGGYWNDRARLNILCFYFAYTERRVIISEMSQFRMSHKQSNVLVDMALLCFNRYKVLLDI